nr:reverse transcriptase domain-containing protein [Tanacetum cinerariifolium]
MHTRSKSYPNNSNATIHRRSNKRRVPNIVEPEIRTIEKVVPMADRTMEELLQAPTEGYGEAIVVPEILVEKFEIKTNLLPDVPNDAIKLMLFAYSLEGAARIWYEKEPPNLILTWDDLDSLNAAAGGNILSKTTREALKIIENKSKVRYSRSKSNVSRVNTNSRDNSSKTDDRIDKLTYQISNLVEIVNKQVITPAIAKAVEKTCVICGGAVGLLTWFESIEAVLHITKCPAESQVEFASSMLQGRAVTWWNTLVQTRGRAAAIAQSWEDFKKLLMEEYYPNDEVEKMEFLRRRKMLETRRGQMIRTGIEEWMIGTRDKELEETVLCVDNASKWVTSPDTIQVELLMKDQDQLVMRNPNLGNNRNRAQGRAFSLGVAEAPQEPNVVTGTFSLNGHFATVLFDSGADYSFISTNFLPLIDIKPSVINPGYEIEIASRMDWLSKLRAKIVCFEKIVQIPLSNGDILEVHGELPEVNLKQLKTTKVNESKLEDIPVVREFPDVFPEDLSGYPHLA